MASVKAAGGVGYAPRQGHRRAQVLFPKPIKANVQFLAVGERGLKLLVGLRPKMRKPAVCVRIAARPALSVCSGPSSAAAAQHV